jgi:hypothetical protein
MIILRCYVDINDDSTTEESLSQLAVKWEFFQKPPFTMMQIDRVYASWGRYEFLLSAELPSIIKEKEIDYWKNIISEISESIKSPNKVNLYLDHTFISSSSTKDYDEWFGIELSVSKVQDTPKRGYSDWEDEIQDINRW